MRLLTSRTLFKRLWQFAYLGWHPLAHFRCASAVYRSQLAGDPLTSLKYLGGHLALSLSPSDRRAALIEHYSALPELLHAGVLQNLPSGISIWRRNVGLNRPALSLTLEPARLAPMEGELQLRLSYETDLHVLTFLLAPGRIFGARSKRVLFVGGVQGRLGARQEMRAASKLNDEISPAAMLVLAIQAIGRVLEVEEIIAIAEDDHVSVGYSPARIMFDYRRLWTQVGGERWGQHYRVPLETRQKPLSEISLSHRARTRRKREAKRIISQSIELRLRQMVRPQERPVPVTAFRRVSEPEPA